MVTPTISLGSGTGGGAGTGRGSGVGPGDGLGSRPRLRWRVRRRRVPSGQRRYVARAASARSSRTTPPMPCARRFRASVWLEAVVMQDGIGRPGPRHAVARSRHSASTRRPSGQSRSGCSAPAPARSARAGADRDRDVLHSAVAAHAQLKLRAPVPPNRVSLLIADNQTSQLIRSNRWQP